MLYDDKIQVSTMKRTSCTIILAIFCILNALADNTDTDSIWNNIDLDQIVVTGTRTPKSLKDVPIQTRVISAADIAKSDATNIEDLLQQELPGVEFSYAMSQQVNMNLSGFAGQSVLFLVDGERLAGETMDNVDFTRINMSNIESVEIVKGSASALYGSCAAGGVINIITKERKDPWSLHFDSRFSEHNGQRYNVNIGLHQGIFTNMFNLSRTSVDNYSVTNKDANAATRTFSEVYGDKTWNFKDNMRLDISKNFKLYGRLGYFYRTLSRSADIPERYRDYSSGVKMKWDITDNDNIEASYSYDQYDKSDFQTLKGLDIRKYSNVQNNTRILFNHVFEEGSILTIGGDYMYDYLMNTKLSGTSFSQKSFDAFSQYDWRINDKWEVVTALRFDNFSDGSSMSRLTPKLSARYQPQRNLNLRASYGMGFRAPTLKEKHYDFDMLSIWIIEGNPDLKAETSHNFNVSAEYTHGAYNFTMAGYYNKVDNHITTGIPFYKPGDNKQLYLNYVNLSKMDVYNVEAAAQARWHSGIGAKLSYVFSHEDSNKAANQYMPTRTHSVNARVEWDKQFTQKFGVNIALAGRALSSIDNEEYIDMYDVSKGTITIEYPAYTLWKLQASCRLLSWAQINVAVDNIFNYKPDYYYFNAPLTMGTNYMIGLGIDIDKIF